MIRGLLVTDPAASAARPTEDVDLIVDVRSRPAYYELAEELRALGFREAMADEDAPICRWTIDDVRADIMPIDPSIFGFTNVWYEGAASHASIAAVPEGDFWHLDAPHFCATKLEAFASRGQGDVYHHDLEDFVALVDGRATLVAEIAAAPKDVREFISETVGDLLALQTFVDCSPGHLDGDDASQARLPLLLQTLQAIAAIREQAHQVSARPTLIAPFAQPRVPLAMRRAGAAGALAARVAPWILPDGRVPLRSSNLAAAEFDTASGALTIEFHSGRIYRYSGVAPQVYEGLLRAYSHGRYFHTWIRNRYPSSRLR